MSEAKDPLRYFRIEAKEISAEFARLAPLLAEARPAHSVAALLRLAHTLKGAAGIVRQGAIAGHAHALEDLLMPHRKREAALTPQDCAAIIAQTDAIASLTAAIAGPAARGNRPAGEDAVIHAEIADMDGLLQGIGETGMALGQLRGLRAQFRQAALAPAETVQAGLVSLLSRAERQLDGGLDLAERELGQLRGRAERLRLLSCRAMLAALERAGHDAAEACGKAISFEAEGGEIRLDARMLVAVQRALVQLVRNAIAHGIETPGLRAAAAKPALGRLTVTIARSGALVSFTCEDDGAGVDLEAVRQAARRHGLSASLETASADVVLQALLEGGLSTAASVTHTAGRGVGMEIVREAAAQLGGKLRVTSQAGQGTRIELVVPARVCAVPALLVESAGIVHAIALSSVRRAVRLGKTLQGTQEVCLTEGGTVLPLVALADLLAGRRNAGARSAALVVQGRGGSLALAVDRVMGADEVVVRPLPGAAGIDPMICGLALDADGVPRPLLDADGLIAAASRLAAPSAPAPAAQTRTAPILVIDDSLTTRALEQNILESAGYEVEQAMSAEEGLSKARARRFGLFLVDVEMPGMGGLGFVEAIRADPALREIPAILVTSLDAPDDRRRGLAAGANDYVVKGAFNQNHFLAGVRRLLEAV